MRCKRILTIPTISRFLLHTRLRKKIIDWFFNREMPCCQEIAEVADTFLKVAFFLTQSNSRHLECIHRNIDLEEMPLLLLYLVKLASLIPGDRTHFVHTQLCGDTSLAHQNIWRFGF